MEQDTFKPTGKLRNGWTTGACATAAAKACTLALIKGKFEKSVTIQLPQGEMPTFLLSSYALKGDKGSTRAMQEGITARSD